MKALITVQYRTSTGIGESVVMSSGNGPDDDLSMIGRRYAQRLQRRVRRITRIDSIHVTRIDNGGIHAN